MSIAIIAITGHGVSLALQLQTKLPGSTCYAPHRHSFALAMGAVGFERLGGVFPSLWSEHRALVCIMATGIAVRLIAPLVRHKTTDPAVVVLDERGHFVISLLSGHLGGANRLAREIAGLTGGQPVITTASDVRERPALDLLARDAGLDIENIGVLSRVARAVLEDEPIWVHDPDNRMFPLLPDDPELFIPWPDAGHAGASVSLPSPSFVGGEGLGDGRARGASVSLRHELSLEARERGPGARSRRPRAVCPCVGVWVSERGAPASSGVRWLELRPRNLVVGIGCNRGTTAGEILGLIENTFEAEGLARRSIRGLASIDLKSDEQGLLEAAEALDRPIRFFSKEEIGRVAVPNPSQQVANHIGVESVCEATALLSAQSAVLIVPKKKSKNATLAVSRACSPS